MANFQLHIPKPCSEKVDKMVKTTAGAFCSSCQKEVVDFTRMSDREIREYFRNKNERTCGRFGQKQLELIHTTTAPNRRWYILAALLGIAILGAALAQEAPTVRPDTLQLEPEKKGLFRKKERKIDREQQGSTPGGYPNLVEGTVLDEIYREPVQGVAVRIQNSHLGTVTDQEGKFTLDLSQFEDYKTASVEFLFIGYKTQVVSMEQLRQKPTIVLKEDVESLGEVVVLRSWSPRGIWWGFRSLFQ